MRRIALVVVTVMAVAVPVALAAKKELAGNVYRGATNQDFRAWARVTSDGKFMQYQSFEVEHCTDGKKYTKAVFQREAPTIKADGTFHYHRVYKKLAPFPGFNETHDETQTFNGAFSKDGKRVHGKLTDKTTGKHLSCHGSLTFRATLSK